MLTQNKNVLPESLISLAKKIPSIKVAIVCADQSSSMEATKKAYELGLIVPIFIGNKKKIISEANKLDWNISIFEIIDQNNEIEAANIGSKLAKENEIKVIIKGNLHTDVIMRS